MLSHPHFDARTRGIAMDSSRRRTGRRRASRRGWRNAYRPRLELMEPRTLLSMMVWDGPSTGDWDMASNWMNSTNPADHHVPTSTDDASIGSGVVSVTHASSASDSVNGLTIRSSGTTLSVSSGTLAIAAASTIAGNLTLSGGTLSPASTLTVSGAMSWSGGTISGGGTVLTQGTLALGGTATAYTEILSGATLDNQATATIAESASYPQYGLALKQGGVLDNQAGATFAFAAGATISSDATSGVAFRNEGSLTSDTAGVATIEAPLLQSAPGSVQPPEGTIVLGGGGTITGPVTAATGAEVDFNGGTFALDSGSSLGGGGTIAVSGGTVNDAGSLKATAAAVTGGALDLTAGQAATVASLSEGGGTIALGGTLTVSGTMGWTGGTISGGGTVLSQGTLVLGGTATVYTEILSGATLDNQGTATIAEAPSYPGYGLDLKQGGVLDNRAGATFTFAAGATLSSDGSSGVAFRNEGILTGTTAGVATIAAPLSQSAAGSLQAATGTFLLDGGGTMAGAIAASAGATLDFNAGAYSLSGASGIAGAGAAEVTGASVTFAAPAPVATTLAIGSGTLSAADTVTVTGAMSWSGGTISGGGTVLAEGSLALGGTATVYTEILSGATLDNQGTATIAEAPSYPGYGLDLKQGGVLDNRAGATFTFAAGATLSSDGTSGVAFRNEGTLVTATTGTVTIEAPLQIGGNGSVSNPSGSIVLSNPITVGGSGYIATGLLGTLQIAGGLTGSTQDSQLYNPQGTLIVNGPGSASAARAPRGHER